MGFSTVAACRAAAVIYVADVDVHLLWKCNADKVNRPRVKKQLHVSETCIYIIGDDIHVKQCRNPGLNNMANHNGSRSKASTLPCRRRRKQTCCTIYARLTYWTKSGLYKLCATGYTSLRAGSAFRKRKTQHRRVRDADDH